MSTTMQPMALELTLPWQNDPHQEDTFKKILKRILIPLLLLFLIVPWLPQIEPEFEEQEIDIQTTQVLLEPVIEPEPEVIPQVTPLPPKPVKKEEPKPIPKEVVKKEIESKVIQTTPKKTTSEKTAEKTAVKADKESQKLSIKSSQGLDKLSSELSAVKNALDLSKLQKKNLLDSDAGSAARASRNRTGTGNVSTRSGGVGVDGELMNNESTTLSEYTTVAVDGLDVGQDQVSGSDASLASRLGQRDAESIRRTLEREKSRLYPLYQKYLDDRPDLAGKFVFKMAIEPDGTISDLTLLLSELEIKKLENTLISRLEKVNFGEEDVSRTFVEYTFVFLPS